jgi:monofunctional biosynthetic peptidoglycan transglycosylase
VPLRKKSRLVRATQVFVLAILVTLTIPPVQVALATVWNPPLVPMQIQRKLEAWLTGQSLEEAPSGWVPLKDIPERFIHFVWASEDQQFFQHHGFDIRRIREAIEEAQDRNDEPRAVSTITMQCARTLFLWQGRSYLRKALEAYYTLWMELLMSKQRILELYLNHIELGPGIYGIGAAAHKYFDTAPDQLSRGQMLALAAILPNPLKWSPTHPNKVVVRKIRRVERLASQAPFPSEELQRK